MNIAVVRHDGRRSRDFRPHRRLGIQVSAHRATRRGA
jgi:hypothetical protein